MKKILFLTLFCIASIGMQAQSTGNTKPADKKQNNNTAQPATAPAQQTDKKAPGVRPRPATAPAQKVDDKSQAKPANDKKSPGTGATSPANDDRKTKKDGTPDKRFKENKHLKSDGTPDRRYKENKEQNKKPEDKKPENKK